MATNARRPHAWSGERPLYQQVKDGLIARISRAEWAPGDALPGEPSLAAAFGVSISTIRAAVRELVQAGVVDRIQGRGTFVASRSTQDSVYQFFHLHPDAGPRQLPRSELIAFSRDRADDRLALELQLGDSRTDRRIYRVRNVLRMHSTVVQVSDIALPEMLFPGLTERRLAEAGPTLYAAYQALFGITVVRTRDTMKAEAMPRDIAGLFSMAKGTPVIAVHRIAFTFHDVAIESRRTVLRTDRYHYRLDQGG